MNDTTSTGIAGNLFEALYNYDLEKRPYELIPELASALPVVSGDGLTYTIQIKPGIHYYDPTGRSGPTASGRR